MEIISKVALSKREIEVLDLIAQWQVKDEEIAKALQITKGSAHNYIIMIMRLTGIRDRTALVRYAQENGFGAKNQSPHRITEALNPKMLTAKLKSDIE